MERLFGIGDLVADSGRSRDEFVMKLTGLAEWYPRSVDALLKMSHYRGELSPQESGRGRFEIFALSHYAQLPYSLWAVYDLMSRGFYYEAGTLVRSLLEVFVQLRYFNVHPELLLPHIKGSKRVQFKAMFDPFSPNFYKQYYGDIYSGISHGRGWQMLFRLSVRGDELSIVSGNAYDEEKASFVANSVLPLVLGFLGFFSICFPLNTLTANADLRSEVEAISNFLKGHMEEHKKAKPDFYAQLEAIITVREPECRTV
jgi:hypothetical protein